MQRRYPYSECFLPQCSASHSAENERFEQSIISPGSQCLKISQKVAFNIASEASYVLSGQNSSKMAKMVQFDEFLTNWSYLSNSVARQATFNRTKIDRKCQNWKIQMRHFGWFSNTVWKEKLKRSQCCYYLQKKSQNPQKSQEKEAWRQLFSRFISCLPAIFSNSPKGENHVRVILFPNIELGTCLLRPSRFFLLEGYLHWWWFPKGPACLFF